MAAIFPVATVARLIAHGPLVASALLTWMLTYLVGILIWFAQYFFDFSPEVFVGPRIIRDDLATRLLLGSLIAPIVETFLFQWLPIRMLRRVFKARTWLAVSASTLAFAAAHGYSLLYVVVALWGGLVFAAVFVLRDYPGGHPFWVVAIAHAARNALASSVL
ncbi:CPBP family glutamic-type intramembrane protease [Burkholderia multivorans]|uniref:CPBP family glutamic-type intramembrane protease n=1 Tax=Burkholderia multivorans TaxID=87883 RepID=UPI0021BE5964|nr:CPBP family glutamic-type intramembrane protease [Burkholderia multivorans]